MKAKPVAGLQLRRRDSRDRSMARDDGEKFGYSPEFTNMTIKQMHLLHFLLNMGIFQCHVSFQGCPPVKFKA